MNALLEDWKTAVRTAAFLADRRRGLRPGLRRGARRGTRATSTRSPPIPRRRPLPIRSRRWSAATAGSAGSPRSSSASPGPIPTTSLEALQRDLSPEARRAPGRDDAERGALRARRRADGASRSALGLTAEQDAGADALPPHVRARRRPARGRGARRGSRRSSSASRASAPAFGQNVLADERRWELALAPADLEGLPADLVAAMAEAAAEPRPRPGTSSRSRAASSCPSCSSRRGATCARRPSGAWTARGAQRRRHRQPRDRRRDPRAPRRAGAAARLPRLSPPSSSSRRWRRRRTRCATS